MDILFDGELPPLTDQPTEYPEITWREVMEDLIEYNLWHGVLKPKIVEMAEARHRF